MNLYMGCAFVFVPGPLGKHRSLFTVCVLLVCLHVCWLAVHLATSLCIHGCHVEGPFSCFNSSQHTYGSNTQVFGTGSKNTWSCMAAPFPCFNSSQTMTQVIPQKVICLLSSITQLVCCTVLHTAALAQRPHSML